MTVSEFFKKIFSRQLFGNCLGMVIITIVLAVGAFVLLKVYTHHGIEVEVPNICGMDQAVAKKKLETMGLKMEVSDTGYVYNAAAFSVLEQSIKPGDKVKPGRVIFIIINANGPRQITLPDVADNCSRREAEDKLRILGFKLAPTEYVVGDPDWVYGIKVNGKNVPAGTKVSINTPITLVVGSGGNIDEYNGNDSIDYLLNAPTETDEEFIESGGGTDAEHSKDTHEEEHAEE